MMEVAANEDVVRYAQVIEKAKILEGSGNAQRCYTMGRQPQERDGSIVAIKPHRPCICWRDGRDDIEQGSLTCAVGPDQAGHRASWHYKIHLGQHIQAAIVLRDTGRL